MTTKNNIYFNNLVQKREMNATTHAAHMLKYNRVVNYLQQTNIFFNNFHKTILLNPNVIDCIKYFISLKTLASRDTYVSLLLLIIAPDKNNIEKNYVQLYGELIDYYRKLREEYRGINDQKKSKKQKDNWVSYEELVKLNNKLSKEYKLCKLNRSMLSNYLKSPSKKEFYLKMIKKTFFEYAFYIALNIHLIYPLRLEISECMVCRWRDLKNLSKEELENNIYLVNSKKKKKTLYMGKNSRKNKMKEPVKLELPIELCNIINIYITMRNILMNPNDPKQIKVYAFLPLFYQSTKKDKFALSTGLTKNGYSKMLTRHFKRHLNKNISATLIRQITVSEFRKGEKSQKEKQELAVLMNNSVAVQTNNYLKFD